MSGGGNETSDAAAARTLRATVEQVDEDVVALDVEGEPLRVPRAWLPGAVREGAGFTIVISPAPEVARALQDSVEARLRALMGPQGGGTGGGTGGQGGAPPGG